jgi:hypothetical protein
MSPAPTTVIPAADRFAEIPKPTIALGHAVTVAGIVAGLLLQQPLLTTLLAAILLPAVAFGPRASLYAHLGARLLARRNAAARAAGHVEDRRLVRFNNTLALGLLLLAQLAFLLQAPLAGWALALALAAVAGVALAGFCLGCFLYFQLRLNRARLLGRR